MSRCHQGATRGQERFPRVSGDEPPAIEEKPEPASFSPRERG